MKKQIDNYLKANRLIYYDDFIIIENYDKIMSISNGKIKTSKYEIIGDELVVKKFDGFILEIRGNVESILIGGNNDESL